jgi:UDP-N-acetyl-2-amino-2-deoxyglucuronate dehydrogenase
MTNYQNRKINFAVIGCGHIGMRHAEMIRRNEEAALLGICDIRPKNELNLKGVEDIPFFSTPEEMLKAIPEIDVVNVCTPNGLHAEHSLKALEHHKHVVCEKPMAITKADCEHIIYKALQVSRTDFWGNAKQVFTTIGLAERSGGAEIYGRRIPGTIKLLLESR